MTEIHTGSDASHRALQYRLPMATVVELGSISMHVVTAGPEDGPAVVLLHGFPDSSDMWRHQTPALANAGYRVICPDLRGFGRSWKPTDARSCRVPDHLSDLEALLDHFSVAKAALIGHDAGAAVGWAAAMAVPDRVERLAALSVGHPGSYHAGGIGQIEKSWYMLWFLHEGVAEAGLAANDWAFFRTWARHAPDVDRWIDHFEADHPSNLTAALGWYRSNVNPAVFGGPMSRSLPLVDCPVLGIWSSDDPYCCEDWVRESGQHVRGPWRYELVSGAGHWFPVERPDRVNALLLEFLSPMLDGAWRTNG